MANTLNFYACTLVTKFALLLYLLDIKLKILNYFANEQKVEEYL